MAMYLVERDITGVSWKQLHMAQRALEESGARLRSIGERVRYLHSLVIPGRSCCLYLVEAPSADLAKQIVDGAGIPYLRILIALTMVP